MEDLIVRRALDELGRHDDEDVPLFARETEIRLGELFVRTAFLREISPEDAAQHVLAERQECHRRFGGDGAGDQHRAAKRAAEPVQAAHKIHGGADGGEVEPVGGADIAPQHWAEM